MVGHQLQRRASLSANGKHHHRGNTIRIRASGLGLTSGILVCRDDVHTHYVAGGVWHLVEINPDEITFIYAGGREDGLKVRISGIGSLQQICMIAGE
jgi:hypothetical protein